MLSTHIGARSLNGPATACTCACACVLLAFCPSSHSSYLSLSLVLTTTMTCVCECVSMHDGECVSLHVTMQHDDWHPRTNDTGYFEIVYPHNRHVNGKRPTSRISRRKWPSSRNAPCDSRCVHMKIHVCMTECTYVFMCVRACMCVWHVYTHAARAGIDESIYAKCSDVHDFVLARARYVNCPSHDTHTHTYIHTYIHTHTYKHTYRTRTGHLRWKLQR